MRDFFAIIAIILAVVGLGVFRVPDENTLVAAGISAVAERVVYQARHPLQITVKGRTVTVSGRVESEAEAQRVTADLAAIDGVETVQNTLTILPQISPFVLRVTKDPEGLHYVGHLPDLALGAALEATLGAHPDLPVAAGIPSQDWARAVQLGAQALSRMLDGQMELSDQNLTLSGRVHLPVTRAAIDTIITSLPSGYTASVAIEPVDDGHPYSLHLSRDPLMGLRAVGKLPPDVGLENLVTLGTVTHSSVRRAPLPLDQPGFTRAVELAGDIFLQLERGSLTVGPGLVSLEGGPVAPEVIAQADALRGALPEGFDLLLALVPSSDAVPLRFEAAWDGTNLGVSGHVPRDFSVATVADPLRVPVRELAVTRSPYPDLSDWSAPLPAGLAALVQMQSGQLVLDAEGVQLTGRVADPAARQAVKERLGAAGQMDVLLEDDGTLPEFVLRFEAATGGRIEGKLPADLTATALADALGLPSLRGQVTVSPNGAGAQVQARLAALRDRLPFVETLTFRYGPEGSDLTLVAAPGLDIDQLQKALPIGKLASHVQLSQPAPPLAGTRRTHVILKQAQIFQDGYWLPSLIAPQDATSCTKQMADAAAVPFADGQFVPGLAGFWPLAHLAAVAKTCTRFVGGTLSVVGEVGSADIAVLGQQLARRRSEAVRRALIARGVPAAAIATGLPRVVKTPDRMVFTWQ